MSQPPSTQPLRILLLSQFFWPEQFRINSFVGELRRQGAEVTVLTGQPNYPAGAVFQGYRAWRAGVGEHPEGYPVARVPLVPRGAGGSLRLALNYLSFLATAAVGGPVLLRDRRFDVIFVYATSPVLQGFAALPLRLIKRAPVALWVQDLWPAALSATGHVANRRLLGAVERLVALLYRRVDLILAQSNAFAEAIRPLAGRTPVEVLPNPGEPAAEASGEKVDLGPGFTIVFAGNLGRAQALDTVVEAAALLRDDSDVRILLFGDGAMSDWIAGQIAERGLTNLELRGRVPSEAMPGIYAQASALLLTLGNDPLLAKTIPSKLQSYLAAGVPVIAATSGEAARIVGESGGGVTCPPADPAALANAIRELRSADPKAIAAMRSEGRAYYEANYDPARLARGLVERLRALAASQP